MDESKIKQIYNEQKCLFHSDTVKCIDRIKVKQAEDSKRIGDIEKDIEGLRPVIFQNHKDIDDMKKYATTMLVSVLAQAIILVGFLGWWVVNHV